MDTQVHNAEAVMFVNTHTNVKFTNEKKFKCKPTQNTGAERRTKANGPNDNHIESDLTNEITIHAVRTGENLALDNKSSLLHTGREESGHKRKE